MSTSAYHYTAIVACSLCGGLGDPYWVDADEISTTYGLCVFCRNPGKGVRHKSLRMPLVVQPFDELGEEYFDAEDLSDP